MHSSLRYGKHICEVNWNGLKKGNIVPNVTRWLVLLSGRTIVSIAFLREKLLKQSDRLMALAWHLVIRHWHWPFRSFWIWHPEFCWWSERPGNCVLDSFLDREIRVRILRYCNHLIGWRSRRRSGRVYLGYNMTRDLTFHISSNFSGKWFDWTLTRDLVLHIIFCKEFRLFSFFFPPNEPAFWLFLRCLLNLGMAANCKGSLETMKTENSLPE